MEFSGEEMTELAANIMAESMYVQCNIDWNEYLLLQAFINQRSNGSALRTEDQKIVIEEGETLRKSTAGWNIYCKWKKWSTSWEKFSSLKDLQQIQVAKYAIVQGIQHDHLTGGFVMSWRKGTNDLNSEKVQYWIPYKNP